MTKIRKLYDYICRAEELISGVFLIAIMIIIFAAGVGRTVGYPIRWGMDMATFLFAWTAFFSADVALRKNRHVNVKALVSRLPERVQYYIGLLNYVIISVFLVFLIRYGITLAYSTRFRTFQGIPGFSYMWVTFSVPLGSLLLLISTILKIKELIETEKTKLHKMSYQENKDVQA